MTALRYAPVLMAAGLWLHEVLLLFGIHYQLARHTLHMNALSAILLLIFSYSFGFCWLHKLITLYAVIVSLCMTYNEVVGFSPEALRAHQIGIVISGAIIFTIYISRAKKYHTCP